MNIFVLDENPKVSARYHCDKHVVKMCLESTQILCTSAWEKGVTFYGQYKPTHKNHPCVLWVGKNKGNQDWLVLMTRALFEEYELRYKRVHGCKGVFNRFEELFPVTTGAKPMRFENCTPFKDEENVVMAYRKYYIEEKSRFAAWEKGSEVPSWFEIGTKKGG